MADFKTKYGPWALIAGASVGLGAAYANALAEKGLNIILIARREEQLKRQASTLKKKYNVHVRTIQQDLSAPDMLNQISAQTKDIHVGLLVYNTAYMILGSFYAHTIEEQEKHIDVNCRGPLLLTHHFGEKMRQRKQGGIILMTSLSGYQGAPWITTYGATKAFNLVLAEGLWYELKKEGVDVLACCAGATATPNFIESNPEDLGIMAPKPLEPDMVARTALSTLGKKSSVIPGLAYRFANFFMGLLPRKQVITIMANSSEKMYGEKCMILNK